MESSTAVCVTDERFPITHYGCSIAFFSQVDVLVCTGLCIRLLFHDAPCWAKRINHTENMQLEHAAQQQPYCVYVLILTDLKHGTFGARFGCLYTSIARTALEAVLWGSCERCLSGLHET